jgi:hypothetical protein
MEQGKVVGARARGLYPEGIFVNEPDQREAADKTQRSLQEGGKKVLFEAPFISGPFFARADLVIINQGSWDLVEVKSGSSQKQEFIEDMAYTAMVAMSSGATPEKILLMILDKNYRLGMEPKNLFQTLDLTSDVLEKVREFEERTIEVDMITGSRQEPGPVLKYNCKECDQFGCCFTGSCDAHIFSIPRISQAKIDQLLSKGITSVQEVPDTFSLTENQENFVRCTKRGCPEIDDSIFRELKKITGPVSYLDFETMMTPIPLYPETGPYETIPTQYSLHVRDRGGVLSHREYIASPSRDCRRDLALRLIVDLGEEGSVVTYSGFERIIISGLKDKFPDLAVHLQAVLSRIVDLEKCIRCILHPGFRGRTSIKVVLPVLVPDLSYTSLEITDGDTAMVTFARAALGAMDEEEWVRKRAALLEYCKMDTYAMVRLHEAIMRMTNSGVW